MAIFLRILVFSLLFLSGLALVFSNYPGVDLDLAQFGGNFSDLRFMSSPGTQVQLIMNENIVGFRDVIHSELEFEINNLISNIEVPAGTLFRLVNTGDRVLNLEIGGMEVNIGIGNSRSLRISEPSQLVIRDLDTNAVSTLSIVDLRREVVFENVRSYLRDGQNEIVIRQRFPLNSQSSPLGNEVNHSFNFNFDLYPNKIHVENYPSITNQNRVEVSGFVDDASYPLYYVVNLLGPIGNTGIMNRVELDSNRFSINVSGLVEGNNSIRFISVDPQRDDVFTGESIISVEVDTVPPRIEVQNQFSLFTNQPRIMLNISTDASILNYTFNNRNSSLNVQNEEVILELNLQRGQNPIVITAIDRAGNLARISHVIEFDSEAPRLVRDSLRPEGVFSGGVSRMFFQNVGGRTSKGEVEMTIFTIPQNARTFDGESVSCNSYENLFVRNLGQLDRDRVRGSELNLDEYQVSLLSLISNERQVTSSANGDFTALITFQERSFTSSDYQQAGNENNREVGSVQSPNLICFIMRDRFGNVNTESFRVTLDAGNTMWRPSEITTIPNTVYAAEIEQTGSMRSAQGRTSVGIIARFQYVGPGRVDSLQHFRVSMDNTFSDVSRHASIDTSRVNYRLDTQTGDLVVYIPVELSPLRKNPLEYPNNLQLGFQAHITYDVEGQQVPIDTRNPIYFQATLNVERPLDHTKWLSPETLEKFINFFENSIEFTRRATEFMGNAAVIGVLTCTGARFWYGMEVAAASMLEGEERERRINDAKETLFMICDRVACTASPAECSGEMGNFDDPSASGIVDLRNRNLNTQNPRAVLSLEELDRAEIVNDEEEGRVLARFQSMSIRGSCDYNGDGEMDGVLVTGTVQSFEETSIADTWVSSGQRTSTSLVRDRCVPARFSQNDDGNMIVSQIDLKGASNACYSPGPPHFDHTRCNFFGADGDAGVPGYDSSNNIIESIRCGCVTDTYSHLKNYLRIQEGIKMCLEQARIGEVRGSYCERLMAQAVCDVATNYIFRTLASPNRVGSDGVDPHTDVFARSLSGLREGDAVLNDRYRGTFWTQAGLGTEQIANKACIAAVTADWSVLTDNILASIDQNEVEPVFGPPFPESRLGGYNPLTGELTVQYRFTYGVVSGGQPISTRVNFICDSSLPGGEHCPSERIDASQASSRFNVRTLTVSPGQSRSDSIVIKDSAAQFRYNVLRFEHTYTVRGETRVTTTEHRIQHKGEFLVASCHFSAGVLGAGAGFGCDTLFTDDAYISGYRIDDSRTRIVPLTLTSNNPVFYEGNKVFLDLGYMIGQNSDQMAQSSFDLAYMLSCPQTEFRSYKPVLVSGGSQFGNTVVELFEIPTLGEVRTTQDFIRFSLREGSRQGQAVLRIRNADMEGGPVSFRIERVSGITGISENINIRIEDGTPHRDFQVVLDDRDIYDIEISGVAHGALIVELIEEGSSNPLSFVGTRISEAQSGTVLERVSTGRCEISFRIVAPGQGSSAIAEGNLDSYDPSAESGRYLTDASLRSGHVVRRDFLIARTPEQRIPQFSITSPVPSGSVCISPDRRSFNIAYVLGVSDNIPETYTLTYNLRPDGFQAISGPSLGIELQPFSSASRFELEIPSARYDAMSSSGSVRSVLSYTLRGEGVPNGEIAREQVFTLTFRDSCLD